jgi:hypothetical protein
MTTLSEAYAVTITRRGAASALLLDGAQYAYRVISGRAATVAAILRQRGVLWRRPHGATLGHVSSASRDNSKLAGLFTAQTGVAP